MNKQLFMQLMQFPPAWSELDMFPDELAEIHIREYRRGQERASEHTRNGAFHWWLRRSPTKAQLRKLLLLASVDPDPGVGWDVHRYLRQCEHFDDELRTYGEQLFAGKPTYD